MTFTQVWSILRWPLAILGLLAVANYALGNLADAAGGMIEFDASGSILAPEEEATEGEDLLADLPEPAPIATLAPGTGPVTDGAATPLADFHVNNTVADIVNDSLVLTDNPGDSIVVAFEIPEGDPGCMSVVTMTMTAEDVRSATEVGVFASTLDDPLQTVNNQQVDGDLRATGTPMAVALIESPGAITFDLTAGFQSYFTQNFAADRPFVLTLVATVPVESLGGVRFVSANTESAEAPTLLWTGTPGCPVDAFPTEE
ncbi:hypothetical protein BH23ACT9_BH23ACT9_31070 [soil metagenome]